MEIAGTKSLFNPDHKEINMTIDALDHMEEAWHIEENPFPAEAINSGESTPYSPTVFDQEIQEFRRKFIRSSSHGNVGFLWSQGSHADTGFGKTTLMRQITKEINRDLGVDTLTKAGVRAEKQVPIAAAYSDLNNLNASGLYPVLFNAVLNLTDEATPDTPSVLDQVRTRIVEELNSDDTTHIVTRINESWLTICGTAPPLRQEVVSAFASDGARGVRSALGRVSATARLRSGLHYLDFALAVLSAAGINHLYLLIDQLEDLATTRSITAAKRSREIGRIRDMQEGPPYVNRVRFVLTFHNRAAQVLERFWEENRLPPFEISTRNAASVVVLRGLKDDDQVSALLQVYLEEHRNGQVTDDLLPFEPGAVTVLREISDGRVGVLLNRARQIFSFAAERGTPKITGDFATQFFANTDTADLELSSKDELHTPDNDIDDLLLDTR